MEEIVYKYLQSAVAKKTSDIHIDPQSTKYVIRFRIDGTLHLEAEGPMSDHPGLVSSVKVLANMNIAETRIPQDGHFFKSLNVFDPIKGSAEPVNLDVRVSSFPSIFGEAITMRVLNRSVSLFKQFEEMGVLQHDAERLREAVRKPHGMILSTGPSGSGKTTMLYSTIGQLQSIEKNIITLEDPVEYQIDNLRQAQVNPAIGFTFSNGLRAILRQDPDVIMVGEIRDNETAEVAIRAALTGRLLLATMHTNDSITAVMRFLEFGIPRSAIANALKAVIAQRLIRLNCPNCIASYSPSVKTLQEAGVKTPVADNIFKRGVGCDSCYDSGFSGRQGIFEILFVDKNIELLILEGATYRQLYEAVRATGFKSLHELAMQLAFEGKTTLEEAFLTTT